MSNDQLDGSSTHVLPAGVVGGVGASNSDGSLQFASLQKPSLTQPTLTICGERRSTLSIPPNDFPTNEERDRMEATMPGCEHGWFESSYEGKQLHYRKSLPASKPKAIVVFHHGIQAHSGAAWITKNGRKLSLAAQIDYYVTKKLSLLS
jgi:hypothetical protein